MTKEKFKIEGMTCSGCVRTVSTILQNQGGVNSVEVTLEPSEVVIEYNADQISKEKLAESIGKMGYTMEVN